MEESQKMASLIRATTPTFKYTFKCIDVADIIEAYLTIEQGNLEIEKDLTQATVGEDYIAWVLTQSETLQLNPGNASVMLNWLTDQGLRGASKKTMLMIEDNSKDEVI